MGRNCYLCVCVYVRFIVVGSFFFLSSTKDNRNVDDCANGSKWCFMGIRMTAKLIATCRVPTRQPIQRSSLESMLFRDCGI